MSPPRIEVHADAGELAIAVAGALLERIAAAHADGRVPQIGLTGGSISEAVHREVARLSPGAGVDWSRVEIWWGDERFVPAGSAERNARQAREAFLDAVGVDPARVHEVPSTDEAADVHAAAAAYSATLEQYGEGGFDVLMLGVGPDGHCASLFPGHPALDVDGAIAIGVTDSPKPPPERVTLTYGALNRSRHTWFLVSGEAKAEAVASALDPSTDPHATPAAGIRSERELVWFLDRASASLL